MTDLSTSLHLSDLAWSSPTVSRSRTSLFYTEIGTETWVCFEASDALDDLIDHVQFWPKKYKGRLVHKGWLNAYLDVKADIDALGDRKFVFCGHSLGGSLAQIAAFIHGGRFISTGSPRPWYGIPPKLDGVRYEVENDIICGIYPWMTHAGQAVKLRLGANWFTAHYPKTYKKGIC